MIYTEEILDRMIGKAITCKIDITIIKDGKLNKQGGLYFICQDQRTGYSISNRLGYSKSWCFKINNKSGILTDGVTRLKLLKSGTYEIY